MQNHYAVLGISSNASADEIRLAYRKLVKIWHPDRNKAPYANDQFVRIQQAYDVLSDVRNRADYDWRRLNHVQEQPTPSPPSSAYRPSPQYARREHSDHTPQPEEEQPMGVGGKILFTLLYTPFLIVSGFVFLFGLSQMSNEENGGAFITILGAVCFFFILRSYWRTLRER